ncbi:winged helix-turn-helix domain-containing protein [Plantactinospora sp. CA-294935]|uniref:winged helix-turn-helix domain-containing protein n=1 Tax=Plantactinospora sp. CA-294935 TaxID=3240012 RepID=UPI003D8CAAF7
MPAYSKTQKLIEDLTRRIESGEFPPGAKLPSRTELCAQYEVSSQTVRIAVERLKAAGIIESVPGGGYYVKRPSTP